MISIFDTHLDLAWNVASFDRDIRLPLSELRQREIGFSDLKARGRATVSLPEMKRGRIDVCLGTILSRCKPEAHPTGGGKGFQRIDLDYVTLDGCYAAARGQLEVYHLLAAENRLRFIRTAADLESHWTQREKLPLGMILAMEGADPILSPAQVEKWFREDGLRVVGLAHYGQGRYAFGTGSAGPLTPAGIELLKAFERVGMIVDLTHSSDPSFFQALDHFSGPVMASHNNCRALVPGDRQFSDEQIKRIVVERKGVIGVVCDAWMLHPGWVAGKSDREVVRIDALADHIDHICQIAGNAQHAAFGSDLDGGYGTEQCPSGLDSIADLQKLAPILEKRGYSKADVEGIFHGNWLRFFKQHLPH